MQPVATAEGSAAVGAADTGNAGGTEERSLEQAASAAAPISAMKKTF